MLANAMQRTVSRSTSQVKSWSSLASAWRKNQAQMLPEPVLAQSVLAQSAPSVDVSTSLPEPDRYLSVGKRVGQLGNMPLFGRSVMDSSLDISIEADEYGIANSLHRKKIKKLLRSSDGAKLLCRENLA
jgi:hypothetical protein